MIKEITIIIATYNASSCLPRCLDSIISQKTESVELIIVDAGSSDGTIKVIKQYESYIDKWISESDKGLYDAWKKGLWDIANKKKFEELLNSLDKNETIVHYHTWTKALSPSLYSVTAKLDFHVVITLHDFFCFCPNGGFYNYQKNEICQGEVLDKWNRVWYRNEGS